MGPNQRRLDMLNKRRDAITDVAERDAQRIVANWNHRRAKSASRVSLTPFEEAVDATLTEADCIARFIL